MGWKFNGSSTVYLVVENMEPLAEPNADRATNIGIVQDMFGITLLAQVFLSTNSQGTKSLQQ